MRVDGPPSDPGADPTVNIDLSESGQAWQDPGIVHGVPSHT